MVCLELPPIILRQLLQVDLVSISFNFSTKNTKLFFKGSTKPDSDGDDDDCILVSDNPSDNQPVATTSENIPSSKSTITTAHSSEATTKSVYAEKTTENNCVPATAASEDSYNTQRQMQSQTAQSESNLKKSIMPNIRNIPAPYPSINYHAQQNEGNFLFCAYF